jgi:hypothetical protein
MPFASFCWFVFQVSTNSLLSSQGLSGSAALTGTTSSMDRSITGDDTLLALAREPGGELRAYVEFDSRKLTPPASTRPART